MSFENDQIKRLEDTVHEMTNLHRETVRVLSNHEQMIACLVGFVRRLKDENLGSLRIIASLPLGTAEERQKMLALVSRMETQWDQASMQMAEVEARFHSPPAPPAA